MKILLLDDNEYEYLLRLTKVVDTPTNEVGDSMMTRVSLQKKLTDLFTDDGARRFIEDYFKNKSISVKIPFEEPKA